MLLLTVVQDAPGALLDVCAVSAITFESARGTLTVPALLAALHEEVCEIVLAVADPHIHASIEARVSTCQVHARAHAGGDALALCDAYLEPLALPPRRASERTLHDLLAHPPQPT